MIEEIKKEIERLIKEKTSTACCEIDIGKAIGLQWVIETLNKYDNQPDYKSDIELFNLANKTLQDKINTLNKGIDELIKKYEEEVNKCDCEQCKSCQTYHKIIQDLKSLKGE